MASSRTSMVTIDRSYFDTIVRRAKFNSESVDPSYHATLDTVYVPQEEYDNLRKVAGQYQNLTHNLKRGGVGEDTIHLLSQDESSQTNTASTRTAPSTITPSEDGGARLSSAATPTPSYYNDRGRNGNNSHYGHNNTAFRRNETSGNDWSDQGPVSEDLDFGDGDTPAESYGHSVAQPSTGTISQRPHYDRYANRTVTLGNLAEGVTHLDITQVIRGGMLLDIYLRTHDKSCAVSFLNANDAKSFYDHARRHDVYIKNKRADIRWADRHFVLPGHVANKIGIGATRNLVIRRCNSALTADAVRDDLEHIHNLVVVKVEFIGGSCFIGTNSVHTAMFARTCMMSRLKYKGSKIEWDTDECAQSLERKEAPARPRNPVPPQQRKILNPMANRFHLLNLEEGDDEKAPPLAANTSVDILA